VATATASGSNTVTTALAYFGPTVSVTVAAGQSVHVTANGSFGSSIAIASASGLSMYICRSQGGALTTGGGGIFGLTNLTNQRNVFGLSHVFLALTAGTYTFGQCGSSSSVWNNNEWGYVTAIVSTQ